MLCLEVPTPYVLQIHYRLDIYAVDISLVIKTIKIFHLIISESSFACVPLSTDKGIQIRLLILHQDTFTSFDCTTF